MFVYEMMLIWVHTCVISIISDCNANVTWLRTHLGTPCSAEVLQKKKNNKRGYSFLFWFQCVEGKGIFKFFSFSLCTCLCITTFGLLITTNSKCSPFWSPICKFVFFVLKLLNLSVLTEFSLAPKMLQMSCILLQ